MSTKAFIHSYKYQIKKAVFTPIISLTASITCFFLLIVGLTLILGDSFDTIYLFCPAMDAFMGMFFLIYGATHFNDFMNTGAANGVSRTTSLITMLASAFTSSAVNSVIISIISPLINSDIDIGELWLLEFLYGNKIFFRIHGENPFITGLRFIGICIFMLFLLYCVGMLFGAICYKLPTKATAVFAIAFGLFITMGYPLTYVILLERGIDIEPIKDRILEAIGRFFGVAYLNGTMYGNFVQGVFAMLAVSAVCALLAWVIVRRSSAKPAPIRND